MKRSFRTIAWTTGVLVRPRRGVRLAAWAIAGVLLASAAPAAAAPPPNDHFENATFVTALPFLAAQETTEATDESGEQRPCGYISRTVWYRWTAPEDGSIDVVAADTVGSDFDTVIAVYTGTSLIDLQVVACNDDTIGLQARIELDVSPGTTYHFQVGGFNGNHGSLVFRFGEAAPECSDGFDNDGDGLTDHPADPGCTDPGDPDEWNAAACEDGFDNDGDGWVDWPDDPGCGWPGDDDEFDTSQCSDGLDNDGDNLTDHPADPGCTDPGDPDEWNAAACEDGFDNDGDGWVDWPSDPGCDRPGDDDEWDAAACQDGLDNDGDGQVDWPTDPGCADPWDESETGFVDLGVTGLAHEKGRIYTNYTKPVVNPIGPWRITASVDNHGEEFTCGELYVYVESERGRFSSVGWDWVCLWPGESHESTFSWRPDMLGNVRIVATLFAGGDAHSDDDWRSEDAFVILGT